MHAHGALDALPMKQAPAQPSSAAWQTARAGQAPMLSVIIPALNEEESIGATIQRCLDARERIRQVGPVRDIQVIVVSDGSTDRTAEIASAFANREPSVSVIVFEKNLGYGAAIKEGFARSEGDLVAFLDADGTCDPSFFGDLCSALRRADAAVALGSRMGPGTQMPRLRRLGNTLYALLLGWLSGQAVSDTASGMRVIRRDVLSHLYPLPDGLHFTPAMSARAIMSDVRIVEIPMPYAERVGESKLRVLRDGVRFLLAIRDAALLYRPSRILNLGAVLCIVIAVLWGLYPTEFYLRNRQLEEWMIYRLLLCGLLSTSAFSLFCAAALSDRILSLVYRRRSVTFFSSLFDRLLAAAHLWPLAIVATSAAVALVWPGLIEYVRTGRVTIHWSRPVAAVFLLQVALVAVVQAVLLKIVDLWKGQLLHTSNEELRDRQ
jgi:glycosyltransferase involved in cell wall biosynthesis